MLFIPFVIVLILEIFFSIPTWLLYVGIGCAFVQVIWYAFIGVAAVVTSWRKLK